MTSRKGPRATLGAAKDDGASPAKENIQDFLDELESKQSKNGHEKNALAVVKLLAPILTTAISRAIDPVVQESLKLKSAIRKNTFTLLFA